MQEEVSTVTLPDGKQFPLPITRVHTLIIGSGAAGLNAAVQLLGNRVEDVLIVTEGLQMGTSINTGSDKQTYYKLSMYGDDADSPRKMAEVYFSGGSMHGDLALVEAALSARAFSHLVNLGVPFPQDPFGQFIGYKTDHDPRQRATSIGPYTSREMCRALIRRVQQLEIEVRENRNVVALVTIHQNLDRRVAGVVGVGDDGHFEAYIAENVIFAVGGPGGLYQTSVYPEVQSGAVGLALLEGATAQNLPESQFGIASIKFRWNVSGTYMQVIPRFISTLSDGRSEEREFLLDSFASPGACYSNIFLKGYQWAFDARKVEGGSSLIDLLVYQETVIKGRRVFLDFTRDPSGFEFEGLSPEALAYLKNSGALLPTPFERLRRMNPDAIELYRDNHIDIEGEPLEIAVCAQHNNGGLAGNHWWESVNIKHLFPIGEVNGSHGVYRPGGAALNASQVGGFRAAEFIANRYRGWSLLEEVAEEKLVETVTRLKLWLEKCTEAASSWQKEREIFQKRMTKAGAHIRTIEDIRNAVTEAREQWKRIRSDGCGFRTVKGQREALRNCHLCFAHLIYLEAIQFAIGSGIGSRGSSIVLDKEGVELHETLGDRWRFLPENPDFRERVLETSVLPEGKIQNTWVKRRPIPESNAWFETAWIDFRKGGIYK
jgi:succinate dehydrogenase/fumarate reductase flavoprotein subunit